MNKFSWIAGEIKAYGLYGAQVEAWVAIRRRGQNGIRFRSTAPLGRRRGYGWPDVDATYVHGRDETAVFFGTFADAVESACRGHGVVDVVSDYDDLPPEVGVHDDAWTPSPSHNGRPVAKLVAKLAADDGLRLVAIRSWNRTVPASADGRYWKRNAVLCVLEAKQAEFLAESLRRFAEV